MPQARLVLPRLFLLGGAVQVLSVLGPYLSRLLIDEVYPSRDVSLAETLVAASVAVIASSIFLQNVQIFLGRLLQADMQVDVMEGLYDRLVDLPATFFSSHRPGEIAAWLDAARTALLAVTGGIQSIARNEGFIILVPPILLSLNTTLALVAVSIIPASAFLMYRQATAAYREMQEYLRYAADASGFRTETFAKMWSLKGLRLEDYCRNRLRELSCRAVTRQRARYKTHAYYSIAINGLRAASLCACTWLGWQAILGDTMTLGEFVAFMAYLNHLYSPLSEVIDSLSSAQEATAALGAAAECLRKPTENATWPAKNCRRPVRLPRKRTLEFHGVSFGYSGRPVFNDLNVRFEDGTTTAVTGASGSGKTTLLQLMGGFNVPQRGCITVDGVDLRHLRLDEWRSQLATVWQSDSLLTGTLWDNLTMGRGQTRAQVNHVVEVCQLEHMVSRLPAGYHTRVGDRGVRLSAGERQRVAVARALLGEPRLLLLDEVTANIDVLQESRLLSRVVDEFEDSMIVIVTHRASAAEIASRVLACREGRLHETGTG